MAAELLAARGLWLFADSSGGPLTGSGHRVGAVSDDAQLIALAHRVHDDARHPGPGAPDNVGRLDDGRVFHADRDRMDPGRMSVPPTISHIR
jgi:hypothetical protein